MSIDYFRCELCGAQLMHRGRGNETKFPTVRRFTDEMAGEGLLAVRCAECAEMPFRLEEGQPFRINLIGREDTHVITGCNSTYNYWPRGIGHLLEVYSSDPSEDYTSALRGGSVEIGFLVEEEVNLIVMAYRVESPDWNVTPYLWHAYKEHERALPPPAPTLEEDRQFTVALVDTEGGKYRAIRNGTMPREFASSLHSAIHEQIGRGLPDRQHYGSAVNGLYNLLIDNKLDSLLTARAYID